MAADVVLDSSSVSEKPCCAAVRSRFLKSEEKRNALRQAVKLLEHQINLLQPENLQLKKDIEEAKAQAEVEKGNKEKEFSVRCDLEKQISKLKADISSLQVKGSAVDKEGLESEIRSLQKLLEKERKRGESEKKKADVEKKKAAEAWRVVRMEKAKAEEEKKLADIERKAAEELRASLQASKSEVTELRERLFEESRKVEAEVRRAEVKQKVVVEKKQTDSELAKAEREKKSAGHLSQLLEKEQKVVESLQKEVEILRREKRSCLCSGPGHDMKKKLFKEKLKLEKMQIKEAKRMVKLKGVRENLLQQEFSILKEDAIQFSRRLNMIENFFFHRLEGTDGYPKDNKLPLKPHGLDMECSPFGTQICHLNNKDDNELLKAYETGMYGAHHVGPASALNAALLALRGGRLSHVISGTNSEMETLVGASIRSKSQNSAIHSTSTSFSDRKFVGSQGREASPIPTSGKAIGENSKEGSTFSQLSGKVTEGRYTIPVGVVSDTDVLSMPDKDLKSPNFSSSPHLSNRVVEQATSPGRKIKRARDGFVPVASLCSEDRKLLSRIEKKLSALHENLKSNVAVAALPQIDERTETWENGNSLQATKGWPIKSGKKRKLAVEHESASQPRDERVEGSLIEKLEIEGNCLKLLDLESEADEKRYRLAISTPLSPNLPDIDSQKQGKMELDDADDKVEGTFSTEMVAEKCDVLWPHIFDVVNLEINCNMLRHALSDPSVNQSSNIAVACGRSSSAPVTNGLDMCHNGNKESQMFPETNVIAAKTTGCKYFVVFSSMLDLNSLSKIHLAGNNCIWRSTNVADVDWKVADILHALQLEHDLLPKEKVCVFFSVLLQNFLSVAFKDHSCVKPGSSPACFGSFVSHINRVAFDVDTRDFLLEMCKENILLSLVEEFLVRRKILIYSDASSEKFDSRARLVFRDDIIISLQSETAKLDQLMAGAVILASIGQAVDNISFICEASYNILRTCWNDHPWVLTVLHCFASVCGKKYTEMQEFSVVMSCIKAIVWFLEQEFASFGNHSGFSQCLQCPFENGQVSVERIVFQLMDELLGHARSGDKAQQVKEGGEVSAINVCLDDVDMDSEQIYAETNYINMGTAFDITDVVSMLELMTYYMGWDWAYKRIVLLLLEFLQSHVPGEMSAAIIILVGQLGRFGIDSGRCEQKVMEDLKCTLLSFVRVDTAGESPISTQIAAVSALVNLFSMEYTKIFPHNWQLGYDNNESDQAMVMMRKWFSQLSMEQQLLCKRFFQSADVQDH